MTPGEFLSRVTSAELTEIIADTLVEPHGDDRADWRAALIACSMAGGKIKDYLLTFPDPGAVQREQHRKAILAAANARSLARVQARKKAERLRLMEEDGIEHDSESVSDTDGRLLGTDEGSGGH